MAEIVFPSTMTVQLNAYGQRLQDEARVAAEKAGRFLHDRVQDRARQDPGWASLADQIEVWSQDGALIIGVREEEFRSQAFALEYGDEVTPPTPLFRTLAEDMREAGTIADDHMKSVFGPGRLTEGE